MLTNAFNLKCTCTPKIFFDMWKGHSIEVHCTNMQLKYSSIMIFKVYGLRADYQISAQIVPIIPANNSGVVVFSKILSDPVIFKTSWSIISLLD